jgi:hypothetical protein
VNPRLYTADLAIYSHCCSSAKNVPSGNQAENRTRGLLCGRRARSKLCGPALSKCLKIDTLRLIFNSGFLVSIKNWKSLKTTDTRWLSWWLRQLSRSESRHLSKIQNGRYKQSGQHTLARQKNIQKSLNPQCPTVMCKSIKFVTVD